MTRPYTTGTGDSFDPRDRLRDPARRGFAESPPPAAREAHASDAWDRDGAEGSARVAGAGKARLVDDVAGILAGLRDRLEAREAYSTADPDRRAADAPRTGRSRSEGRAAETTGGPRPSAAPRHPADAPVRRPGAPAAPSSFGQGARRGAEPARPPSGAAPGEGWMRDDAARRPEPFGLGALRAEILDLQRGMNGLATRSEILDIERQIRALAAEVVETRSPGAVEALAARLDEVQAQIGGLAREIPRSLHERVGAAVELLNWKIDTARGGDAADLRALGAELAALRRGLGDAAEPRRLDELADEVGALRALVADLRLHLERDDLGGLRADLSTARGEIVAQGDDLAAVRAALDGMRRALVGEGGAGASLPAIRAEIGQRLDALLRRPAPESFGPVVSRLAAIEDGLARLRAEPGADLAVLAASVEQAAAARVLDADRLAGRFDRVDEMLRTIRERTDPGGLAAALDASQASLAALDRKVGEVAAKFDLDSLSALRDSLRGAIGAPAGGADPALLGRLEALDARLRELAAREPERLEPLREQLAAVAGRLDRLAAGPVPAAAALPEGLAERLTRIEELMAAQRPVAEGLVLGVERLGRLEEGLAGRAQSLDHIAGTLERLDDGLRHVAEVSDTASVEILLRSLGSRLDEIHASREQVERLEAQIAALAAALERGGRPDPAIELLHRTVGEAVAEMRALREESAEADPAAPGSPPELDAILRDLQDLKSGQAAREDRTQEALAAIRAAMDALVLRLPPRDAAPARPDPANDAALPVLAAPDAAVRLPAAGDGEGSWTARFRAALQRRGRAGPAPAAPSGFAPDLDRFLSGGAPSAPRDLDARPSAGAPPPPEGEAAPEPVLPKATVPEFRPIVIGASRGDEPAARIRSSFIAALRRNQAADEGRAPGEDASRAPGGRLRSLLLVGGAAAAIAAGAWSAGGPARIGQALAGVAAGVEAWRAPPARPRAVAQAQPAAKPAAEAPKPQPAAAGAPPPAGAPHPAPRDPAAAAGARTAAAAPEAAASPVETGSLPAAAKPAADDLPAGIPARLRPAVLAGNPAALYELASLLVQGREMPKDPALGARILERAALAGLVPAQFSLGQLYETGVGVSQDLAQAQAWYRRAAERGNTYAMQNLGVLLAAGTDGKADYPSAIPWFRQAADLGVRDSQYNLAVILAWGMGTPRNPVEAYKWFALAAKGGDQEAAAKRDELARELAPADLAAARAAAEGWRARMADRAANTVPPVPQGVSDAGPPKPANGRV